MNNFNLTPAKIIKTTILFVTILVASLTFNHAAIAAKPNIYLKLSPDQISFRSGQVSSISIIIGPSENQITGIDLTLSFDKNVLEILSFNPSPFLNNKLINRIDNKNGILRYSAVDIQGQKSNKPEILGTLVVRAKNNGKTEMQIKNFQAALLGMDQSFSSSNNKLGIYSVTSPQRFFPRFNFPFQLPFQNLFKRK